VLFVSAAAIKEDIEEKIGLLWDVSMLSWSLRNEDITLFPRLNGCPVSDSEEKGGKDGGGTEPISNGFAAARMRG
jgi:hypothetical protein